MNGIGGAEHAYGEAQRQDRTASWLRDVAFVKVHHRGRIVVRGTFAGGYLDVDDVSGRLPDGAAV